MAARIDPRRPYALAINAGRAFARRNPRLKRVMLALLGPIIRRLRVPPLGIGRGMYRHWIAAHDTLDAVDREAIRAGIARMAVRPRISVVLTGSVGEAMDSTAASVRAQIYPEWDLPADDAAAGGEWVMWLAAGDRLAEHALYEFAVAIAAHPEAQLVYADEDRIDAAGRRADPWFKPDFDPELLLGWNYLGRPVAIHRSLLTRIGGARPEFGDVAEHDLMLRATEAGGAARIHHIPTVLCHRGDAAASGDAVEASRRAVREHLAARGIAARVEAASLAPDRHRIRWPEPAAWPLVSAVVPTRDGAAMLSRCLDGLLHRTDYAPIEVLIVDNGSEKAETHALFGLLRADPRVRILPAPGPFNFAGLNNLAVAEARGEIILQLNNDIDVIGPGWLREMVTHAMRPEIGAVGAKLLYANGRLQHGATVLGVGIADHILTGARRTDPGPQGLLAVARCASAVTSACLALRRSVYQAVGGMDAQNLPVAFNDVDLCLRIGALGLRVLWTPFAELYHLESASRGLDLSGAKLERFLSEQAYMRARWGRLMKADPFWNPNLSLSDVARSLAFPPRREKPWWRAPA